MTGAGQQLPYTDLPGKVFAPNLTPDKESGIGNWTDDMLARAIREGISYDGRALFGIMPFAHYRNMPDEDLASIIVYLRTLRPVINPLPKTEIIFPVKYIMRNDPQPITDPVAPPDVSDPVKRGRFLVNLTGCTDCHTPVDNHHVPIPGLDFSGGQVVHAPWDTGNSPDSFRRMSLGYATQNVENSSLRKHEPSNFGMKSQHRVSAKGVVVNSSRRSRCVTGHLTS